MALSPSSNLKYIFFRRIPRSRKNKLRSFNQRGRPLQYASGHEFQQFELELKHKLEPNSEPAVRTRTQTRVRTQTESKLEQNPQFEPQPEPNSHPQKNKKANKARIRDRFGLSLSATSAMGSPRKRGPRPGRPSRRSEGTEARVAERERPKRSHVEEQLFYILFRRAKSARASSRAANALKSACS